MAALASFFRRRLRRPFGGRETPPGDQRLLNGGAAERLARATSVMKALDQAIAAITMLRRRRSAVARPNEVEVQDLALLQFGIIQYLDCLDASGPAGWPGPEEIYGCVEGGLTFCGHLRTFRDQLCGPHARLVGASEAIALLRRVHGQAVLQGVVARSRRPDRLTSSELAQMIQFMERARGSWMRRLTETHRDLLDELRVLSPQELDELPRADH
jgi:hypothetical protein